MNDLLKQSALAYYQLTNYSYYFTLGHKGKSSVLRLCFPVNAYYHLAAFHKVGFKALANKNKALDAILEERVVTDDFIAAGYHFEDRWMGICRLKGMLEANQAIFHYRGHERVDSRINADYLLQDEQTVFFVAGDHPLSIFGQKGKHYERNCPRMTTLLIIREEISNGRMTEIYRAKSFRE